MTNTITKREARDLLDADRRINNRRDALDSSITAVLTAMRLDMAESKLDTLSRAYDALQDMRKVLDKQQEAINKAVRE